MNAYNLMVFWQARKDLDLTENLTSPLEIATENVKFDMFLNENVLV